MKTHNDGPSNPKGAPTQPNRSASDAARVRSEGNKDANKQAPAKLPATGDSPKSGVDMSARNRSGSDGARPGAAHKDSDRKPK